MKRLLLLAGIAVLAAAFSQPATGAAKTQLELRLLARVESPTALTSHRDSTNRILVTERSGRVRVIKGGVLRPRPLLNIRRRVASEVLEQGLLGIALPPDHNRTRRFYVMFTRNDGDLVVEEWRTRAQRPDLVDPSSRRHLIRIPRQGRFMNHNGGALRFLGTKLFITVGDGSNPGDIFNQAQDPNSLRGKILRIVPRPDRLTGRPYRIPPGNPFVGRSGRPEVFATGLRNPHALHFHRAADGSYEATVYDVGQFRFEEVNHLSLKSLNGANFGWKAWEGYDRYDCGDPQCPNSIGDEELPGGPVFPVHAYGHDQGCAVIGGPVVRDDSLVGLTGRLVFGDYCSGTFQRARPSTLKLDPVEELDARLNATHFPAINAINEDAKGRIFVLSNRMTGVVYRLAASR